MIQVTEAILFNPKDKEEIKSGQVTSGSPSDILTPASPDISSCSFDGNSYNKIYYWTHRDKLLKNVKEYSRQHREEIKTYHHNYNLKNKERRRTQYRKRREDPDFVTANKLRSRKWKEENPDAWQKWYSEHRDRKLEEARLANIEFKKMVMLQYSEGCGTCVCCGESNSLFLTLDHIANDGKKHRETWGHGSRFYKQLAKANFPDKDKLQVLCWNCNEGKRFNRGVCPHQDKELKSLTR